MGLCFFEELLVRISSERKSNKKPHKIWGLKINHSQTKKILSQTEELLSFH
jgi:hypothetical protein